MSRDNMYNHFKGNRDIFDFIQQDALDGFWVIDVEEKEKNLISDRFWEVLGYEPAVMSDDRAARDAVVFQEDLTIISECLLKHHTDHSYKSDLTVRFHHKNGKTRWMKFKGKSIPLGEQKTMRVLVVFIDVTKEKEMESFLISCNSAANIGYWEVNFETMKVLWSPVTKSIHGVNQDYEPELETAIQYYKEGRDRQLIADSVRIATETGQGYNVEVILITANGEERWVKAFGFSEMNDGVCVRLYGTFQDIDERKRSELEMVSLLNVTRDQNMRLQNFKNIVSHNLRSHSGNIELMSELLKKDVPEIAEVESYKLLKNATNNLSETIHHLGEVSKVNSSDKTKMMGLSLKEYVEKAVGNVAALAIENNVKVINEVTLKEKILGFPAYLESVVLNFLTNAIKYRSEDRNSFVRLSTQFDGTWISLLIEDNGLGIDLMRHKDKLFGMYKTFHENQDSRGIGLFITRNHIEAMDGNIEVESELGKGSLFKINFKYEKV